MNTFADAERFLNKRRLEYASEDVSYAYITGGTVSVSAAKGESIFTTADVTGVTIKTHVIDFIIPATSLSREPQKGDVITVSNKRFEVNAPNNEPCWRYTGNNFDTYRIHTLEVY